MIPARIALPLLALALAACGNGPVMPPSDGHIRADRVPGPVAGSIPEPVQNAVTLVRPRAAPRVETYSVVVNNVRVQDLLFALARDAGINVDIHPGINGTVTLNAIDQTLKQLLTRIARQVDLRWEMDGQNLAVMPDTPYLRNYRVDYVNMSRDTSGTVTVTTQIAATGTGAAGGTAGAGGSGGGGNNSLTEIRNKAQNRFWETLERNLKDLLRETDKILPEGSSETTVERTEPPPAGAAAGVGGTAASRSGAPGPQAGTPPAPQTGTTVVRRTTFREAASIIVNPESGIVTARATSRQHEKVQEFLDQIMASARRQVLIETTVAEVSLSDQYQQGIQWDRIRADANATGLFAVSQNAGGAIGAGAAGLLTLGARHVSSSGGVFTAGIKLLETFGTVKVISSPKLSVINNQTAVLKVVDNLVYFTVKADTISNQTTTTTTYTTNLHSVPVGLVMNVTPQISESDSVLLNIRPSISRKYAEIDDPNPELRKNNITSKIPVIRTREMESMIRVESGDVAVMGGLMEDSQENGDTAVPGLSTLPVVGNLFQSRDDKRTKTELVVFLRPIVVRNANIGGDYASFRSSLPAAGLFEKNRK